MYMTESAPYPLSHDALLALYQEALRVEASGATHGKARGENQAADRPDHDAGPDCPLANDIKLDAEGSPGASDGPEET